jgi:hypothetical protein
VQIDELRLRFNKRVGVNMPDEIASEPVFVFEK